MTIQGATRPETSEWRDGLVLDEPPPLPPSEGAAGLVANAIPMLGSLGSVAYVATAQPGRGGLIASGMFLVSSVGFVVANGWRQRSQRVETAHRSRSRYFAYLDHLRGVVRAAAAEQRAVSEAARPDPTALAALLAVDTGPWPDTEEDGLVARFGRADGPAALSVRRASSGPLADADLLLVAAADRFVATHAVLADLPVEVDLDEVRAVEVLGPGPEARAVVRAVVAGLCFGYAPSRLRVVVAADAATVAEWEWAKWLPHTAGMPSDAVGPVRLISASEDSVTQWLDAEPPGPGRHTVLVWDRDGEPDADLETSLGGAAVTVLAVGTSPVGGRRGLALRVGPEGGRLEATGRSDLPALFRPDRLTVAEAEAVARRLAGRQRRAAGPGRTGSGALDAPTLLGLGDVDRLDVPALWAPRPRASRLRATLGTAPDGAPVVLDLKQPAEGGSGPHGLLIGATGSGKSELLRTLVLSLVAQHGPDVLNLVLVDFKGGATFAGLSELPHVSALITNLAAELTLVERMEAALTGEIVRRQELLRAAGNLTSIVDYDAQRGDRDPLPDLLVICDEFSELLTARPELVDLFVQIGRVGRSLGIHLLLASQRLEEGRLRGLDSHLSYRIGLRTFSASESRAVLGVPDAAELPSVPGVGYLKTGPTEMERFTAAYVSGPVSRPRRAVPVASVLPFTAAPVVVAAPAVADAAAEQDRPALLDAVAVAMAGRGRPAHRVWLPPLDLPASLDALLPDLAVVPGVGLTSADARARGVLRVPVGLLDRPLEQRRDTLVLDLAGAGGHVGIVGGPRSGRSTLAKTLVCSLALTATPREVQVYVLDFGGGSFGDLADLPHVSGVATRGQGDVVARVVAEVIGILRSREEHFRAHGIADIDSYRLRRAAGDPGDGYGDVVLVVDGWGTVRSDFEALEPVLQDLAGRGLTYGVHLVATAARWLDFRTQLKDLLGTRVELRLGDPSESEIDRRLATSVPSGRPGRGLATTRHHLLGALPRIDGGTNPATTADGVADLVARVRAGWGAAPAPRLRLLPELVTVDELGAQVPGDPRVLLGLDETRLGPIGPDLRTEPHLYLFGESGSGKTTVLRTYAAQVLRRKAPEQAQLVLIDPRRALLGEVPAEYLTGYWTTGAQIADEVSALAAYLQTRLPGPDVTPEQLRARSWWRGPDVFVLVDDYDLVTGGSGTPLAPLVPLLGQAGDVGLHLVLARRSGGAARALYDPVIQTLRDCAAPGLVLSGSPDEGALVGSVRPQQRVPGRGTLVARSVGTQVVQIAVASIERPAAG